MLTFYPARAGTRRIREQRAAAREAAMLIFLVN
jgi:hypothetical protein